MHVLCKSSDWLPSAKTNVFKLFARNPQKKNIRAMCIVWREMSDHPGHPCSITFGNLKTTDLEV